MTREEARERINKMLAYMESLDADEEEKKDVQALNMAIEALQYLGSRHLTDLYVLDKRSGRIHRIGDGNHDSLGAYAWDEVHYSNLQNGDGGGLQDEDGYGYVILKTDAGCFNDEYGIIDKRYEKEITAYLKENGYDVE